MFFSFFSFLLFMFQHKKNQMDHLFSSFFLLLLSLYRLDLENNSEFGVARMMIRMFRETITWLLSICFFLFFFDFGLFIVIIVVTAKKIFPNNKYIQWVTPPITITTIDFTTLTIRIEYYRYPLPKKKSVNLTFDSIFLFLGINSGTQKKIFCLQMWCIQVEAKIFDIFFWFICPVVKSKKTSKKNFFHI